MKKKIIITILVIVLLAFTYILSIYSLIGIAKLDATKGIKIPFRIRTKIVGWEATYGPGRIAFFSEIIIFLFYLLLFSVIIFFVVRLIRKIKERNRI